MSTSTEQRAGDRRRVLHLALFLEMGGAERMICNLAAEQHRRGHLAGVCCLREPGVLGPELEAQGIKVFSFGGINTYRERVRRLAEIVLEHDVEVIHSHNGGAWYHGALLRLKQSSIHLVHTVHGFELDRPRDRFRNWLAGLVSQQAIAVSEELRQHLCGPLRIAPSKCSVILNGVDVESFAKVAHAYPPLEAPRLLHVGRLEPVKNQTLLLEAFAALLQKAPDAQLDIVGSGSVSAKLQQHARGLGIDAQVNFHGEQLDVLPFLAGCHAMVMSSHSEGTPMVVLEAMASGRPVIATAVGGLPDLIEPGVNGYLSEPGNAAELHLGIEQALAEPAQYQRLCEGALTTARAHFSVAVMADRYDQAYQTG
ncbi:MAG: glycosyltransferase family 4 protein [Pseudomonadota bacterium]